MPKDFSKKIQLIQEEQRIFGNRSLIVESEDYDYD